MDSIITISAVVLAFVITAVSGRWIIPALSRLKFGQNIRDEGPKWHKGKQGTPTMGGLMFIIAIVVATAAVAFVYPNAGFELSSLDLVKLLGGLGMAFCFGLIGFLDDYISVKKKRNLGLSEMQKLILQFAVAGAYLASVAIAGGSTETIIPFLGRIELGIFYYVISAIIIVGMVNAVNFTDGIDGLNTIVCFCSFLGLAVCAYIIGASSMYMFGVISAAALIGFLIWNFNPAKVFMGDTGSLFLGGILCALAFGIDMPVLLLPAGIVSIIEIVSVVLQVTYFKATKGKRLFKMSPIHHHFEMSGWSEIKICLVFGLVSLLGAAACVLLVNYGL